MRAVLATNGNRLSIKTWLLFGAKIALSAACLYYLFRKTQLSELDFRNALSPYSALALLFMLAQFPIAALRWQLIVRVYGHRTDVYRLQELVWIGQVINQIVPTLIAGDAFRVARLSQMGVPLSISVFSLLLERGLGLLALCVITVAGTPVLLSLLSDGVDARAIAACAGLGLLLTMLVSIAALLIDKKRGLIALPRPLLRLLELGVMFVRQVRLGGAAMGLAILSQLLACLAFYMLARGSGVDASLLVCLVLMPTILFATMLPISIGGWGVREGALVYLFTSAGVPGADALALSIQFGLLTLVAALPGALFIPINRANGSSNA